MALSGSVSVEATPNANDMLVFSWEATQDTKAKTSTITWKMELVAGAYGQITGVTEGTRTWTVTIDDQTYSGSNGVNIGNNETRLLAEGTTVLAHEEDGTKTFDFTFAQQIQITWSGTQYIDTASGSGTGELDPIAVIEKFDILGYVNGYIMALCGRAVQWPKRKPAAFLYNGERLSDIHSVYTPELQKTHPFAIIKTGMFLSAKRTLYLFQEDAYYFKGSNNGWYFGGTEENPIPCYASDYDESNGTWGELTRLDNFNVNVGGLTTTLGDMIWANFDVTQENGTVYLAASEPVPVYE